MTGARVELVEVTAGYKASLPIVHGLTEVFEQGQVTTLVGPNGAGKSTVLRTIFGLARLLGGTILVDGADVSGLSQAARIVAGVSFCPQGRCNFPGLTVAENLRMAGFTVRGKALRQRMDNLRQQFPVVADRWTAKVGNLSGGQQQLVEIAMALLQEPRVLLIDEPSLGLSPRMQRDIFAAIRAVADRGLTVIMVEQNVRAALAISDRALVLDRGAKVLSGPAAQVGADERIKHVYLGAPPEPEKAPTTADGLAPATHD